jgi:hypothetical protein
MAQNPTIQISVRVDSSHADAVDAYCRYLSAKRHALVSRSDLIRLAISKLPVPTDAPEDLKRSLERLAGSSWT